MMPIFSSSCCANVDQLFVRHVPQARPTRCRSIPAPIHTVSGSRHQVRAPVVEDLQAADHDVGFLNIDPVVLDQLAGPAFVLHHQFLDQQSHGDEVAIEQRIADFPHLPGHIAIEAAHQVFDRHGREQVLAPEVATLSIRGYPADTAHAIPLHQKLVDVEAGDDFSTLRSDFAGDDFPQLPRTQLGIQELFDQRGFRALLLSGRLDGAKVFFRTCRIVLMIDRPLTR